MSVLCPYLAQILVDLKNASHKRCSHGPCEQLLLVKVFDLSKSKFSFYLVDPKSLTALTQDDTADTKEILVVVSPLCTKVSF